MGQGTRTVRPTMGTWDHVTMGSWDHIPMRPRDHGTMEPCHRAHGKVRPRHGPMRPCDQDRGPGPGTGTGPGVPAPKGPPWVHLGPLGRMFMILVPKRGPRGAKLGPGQGSGPETKTRDDQGLGTRTRPRNQDQVPRDGNRRATRLLLSGICHFIVDSQLSDLAVLVCGGTWF